MSLWIRYDSSRQVWEVSPNEKEHYFSDLIENFPREVKFGRWIDFEAYADSKNMGVLFNSEGGDQTRRVRVYSEGDLTKEVRRRRGSIQSWGPNQVDTRPALAPVGKARMYFDRISGKLLVSLSGEQYRPVVFGAKVEGLLPSDFAGLQGWWKADAGVFSDAGSTPAVDTNTVQQWNDQSGNARHFSQATATNRPTFRTGIVNGKPVIRFDGVDNFMATAATMADMFTSTSGTIFVVAYVTAITTNGAAAYANDQVFSDQIAGPGVRHCLALKTTPVIIAFNYDGTEDTASKTVATGTWYSMLYKMGGGNVSVGLNDARDASLTSAASGASTSMTGILRLGVNYDSTVFTEIDIAEMAIFNVDVIEADRKEIESGFASKYSITLPY